MANINLYYYNKEHNFGDILNEYIPEKLFNCKIQKSDIKSCNACFIGSILSHFLSKSPEYILPALDIWGSGFIRVPNKRKKFIRKVNVHALRGKYTKELLEKLQNKKYDVPLGDPGLLCSKIFKPINNEKIFDYGIIPHYVDKTNKNLKKLKLPNSIILDIESNPKDFLSKLVKCKKIISSAMHGLIAADSFGIPNIRMIVSDEIIGGDFKYNDYYSVFGIDNHNRIDLRISTEIITKLDFEYTITKQQVEKIQNDLIESFPYA